MAVPAHSTSTQQNMQVNAVSSPVVSHKNQDDHPEKDIVRVNDPERGSASPNDMDHSEKPQSHKTARFYARYRILFHLFIWLLFTGCVSLVITFKIVHGVFTAGCPVLSLLVFSASSLRLFGLIKSKTAHP